MNAEVSSQLQSFGRRWFRRSDLDGIFIVALVCLPHFAGNKIGFAFPVAVALTICYCIASFVDHGDLSEWRPIYRWSLGACAVAIGVWLFLSTPTLLGRIAAVIVYAALYWICDQTLQRRLAESGIR